LGALGFVGLAGVEVAVDEVGITSMGRLMSNSFSVCVEEIVGDGGDAVALLDGKFG
jgi:hypothetical protein